VRHPRALQPGVWKRTIKEEVEAERWWRPEPASARHPDTAEAGERKSTIEEEVEAARRSGGGEARREAFPFFSVRGPRRAVFFLTTNNFID
jgi:hypothetical protein